MQFAPPYIRTSTQRLYATFTSVQFTSSNETTDFTTITLI